MGVSELHKNGLKRYNLTDNKINLLENLPEEDICALDNGLQLHLHQLELEAQNDELCEAQKKLQKAYEKFDDFYHTAPCGCFTLDKDGRIIEANHTFANQVGIDNAYLIDESVYHYIVNADKEIFYLHLKRIFNDKTPQSCEIRLKGREDGEIWGQLNSMFAQDSKEDALCRTYIFDITKYKRTEERLCLLLDAFNKCRTSVMITNREGRIEYVNSHFTRTTGYSAEEVYGETPRILKSGRQLTELYKEMWHTIISGKEWSGTFYNKKKNGSLYKELFSVSPLRNKDGAITHFVKVTIE